MQSVLATTPKVQISEPGQADTLGRDAPGGGAPLLVTTKATEARSMISQEPIVVVVQGTAEANKK